MWAVGRADPAVGAVGPLIRTCPPHLVRLGDVLRIPAEMVEAIVAHARADHPDEACGIIAGPAGSNRPTRLVPMTNAERSPTFYRFDSGEQLRLYKQLDAADEEVVVVYHSHTATEAYPSRSDISYAGEPQAHYVLVSTRETDSHEFRSFRIIDGVVTEEAVEIISAGPDVASVSTREAGSHPVSAANDLLQS